MRCTTRKATTHMYTACKSCPDNISTYGICRKGHENYFFRRGKDNRCPKAMQVHHKEAT